MKIYIAGPMTGLEDFNRPAFHTAEADLIDAGYTVLNPARITEKMLNLDRDPEWSDWMRAALRLSMNADGICLLPGWDKSVGANLEFDIAVQLGMGTGPLGTWIKQGEHDGR